MDKFISCEELSKQEKRKIDHAIWQTWGNQNPVRRSPKNSKSYSRKKVRNWKRDHHETSSRSLFSRIYLLQ